jgi:GTP-binding protein Era
LPGLIDPSYLLQERMRELALERIRAMDLLLYLHPAPEAPAPPFETVVSFPEPLRIPLLPVYTKGDLVSAEEKKRLEQEAIVVTASDGGSVEALLTRIRPALPEREFEYDPDDIGTQPLRFFVVEYLREAAFLLLGDELPYSFAGEVEEFREAERPMYIRVTLFVERESQKRIVIGRSGSTIKAIGAHARTRLEALTGAPVYLDCWVKTLPNWRKNSSSLARFGFPAPAPARERPTSAGRSPHDSRS